MTKLQLRERERTIELLRHEVKPYYAGYPDTNRYNEGFSDGIHRAIFILETEIQQIQEEKKQ